MPGDSPVAARTISLVKDPTGAPAVNLSKVREAGHVDLVKRAEKAGISLSKRNMSGLRGAVRLYVDHSGSMEFPNARTTPTATFSAWSSGRSATRSSWIPTARSR